MYVWRQPNLGIQYCCYLDLHASLLMTLHTPYVKNMLKGCLPHHIFSFLHHVFNFKGVPAPCWELVEK